jgi:lipoprotein-releasing system ATP-binding protein
MTEKKLLLKAENLTKEFRQPTPIQILKGVSLSLYAGESIAIMGASGEGKSTLLHLLGTLDTPLSGKLEIMGKDAFNSPASIRGAHIGFIFQNYNLLEDYTALQNVLMPAFIQKQPIHKNSDAYHHGLTLLERVQLSSRKDFSAKLLSGGEKQRVAIARALCNNPEIILADEPSGNLDHESSKLIHSLLLSCTRELNKGLIVVTHDHDLAALCDTTYTLCNGELIPYE